MAKKFRKLMAVLLGAAVLAGSVPAAPLVAFADNEIETPEIVIADIEPVGNVVTLDGNGGKLEDGRTVVTVPFTEDDVLGTVIEDVGIFENGDLWKIGWATSPDGADAESAYSIHPVAGQTYYAIWGRPVEVTFDGNGAPLYDEIGEFSEETSFVQTVVEGSKLRMYNSLSWKFDPPHKNFVGWALTEDATEPDDDAVFTEGMTVYAVWEYRHYTVVLDANGGYFGDKSVTTFETGAEYGKTLEKLPSANPTSNKKGQVFKGWYYDQFCKKPIGMELSEFSPREWTKLFAGYKSDGTMVSKITLSKKSATILVGKSGTLTATVTPKTALNKELTWTSSNKNIATVSAKGVVKGIAPGTVTITAKAKDGSGVKATCKLTVNVKYVYECSKSGVYRYTTDTSVVKKLRSSGWSYRKAFRAPGLSSQKVYYIYNKTTKRYRYTNNLTYAKKMKAAGHKVGTAFYQATSRTVPVYELSKGSKRVTYYYTTSAKVRKQMQAEGWKETGIAWYAQPK